MKCMYCQEKTKNLNHVCDACERESRRMARLQRKRVVECCPECGEEIDMMIHPTNFMIPFCPYCGEKKVILCNECMDKIGDCDKNNPEAYCKKLKEDK